MRALPTPKVRPVPGTATESVGVQVLPITAMASRPRPGKPSPRHLAQAGPSSWPLVPCPSVPSTPPHPKVLTGLRTCAGLGSHLVPSIGLPAAPAPPPSTHWSARVSADPPRRQPAACARAAGPGGLRYGCCRAANKSHLTKPLPRF